MSTFGPGPEIDELNARIYSGKGMSKDAHYYVGCAVAVAVFAACVLTSARYLPAPNLVVSGLLAAVCGYLSGRLAYKRTLALRARVAGELREQQAAEANRQIIAMQARTRP